MKPIGAYIQNGLDLARLASQSALARRYAVAHESKSKKFLDAFLLHDMTHRCEIDSTPAFIWSPGEKRATLIFEVDGKYFARRWPLEKIRQKIEDHAHLNGMRLDEMFQLAPCYKDDGMRRQLLIERAAIEKTVQFFEMTTKMRVNDPIRAFGQERYLKARQSHAVKGENLQMIDIAIETCNMAHFTGGMMLTPEFNKEELPKNKFEASLEGEAKRIFSWSMRN